jgi:hypothetical protein
MEKWYHVTVNGYTCGKHQNLLLQASWLNVKENVGGYSALRKDMKSI